MGPVVVETERLRLREWTREDARDFLRLARDRDVVRFINGGQAYTRAQVGVFIERQLETQRDRGWCRWAVELASPVESELEGVIGFCGPGCTFAPEVEVGWWILRSLWGRGLATEAGSAAVRFCFETIGFERLICCVHRDNLASLRVAEKVGFRTVERFEFRGLPLIKHELRNPLPWRPNNEQYRLDCAPLNV